MSQDLLVKEEGMIKNEDLMQWQKDLIKICETYTLRQVNIIYDPDGNSDKTTVCRWIMDNNIGTKLLNVNNFKDVMRKAMNIPPSKCYLIDMPRAINGERLIQLYAGIKELKSGYCFDDRYHFKRRLFDPPAVVVFINRLPDEELLSYNLWKIWTITNEGLKEYVDLSDPIN